MAGGGVAQLVTCAKLCLPDNRIVYSDIISRWQSPHFPFYFGNFAAISIKLFS